MKILVGLFLSLLFCTPAWSFTFNNSVAAAFSEDRVTISIADFTCQENGLTKTKLKAALQTAVGQYWNKVPSSRLTLVVADEKTVAPEFYTDSPCLGGGGCTPNPDLVVSNGILVSCNENATIFSNPRILGVSLTNNIDGRRLKGSLILLNDAAGSQLGNRDQDELVAVLAHEIGHAIGLGHSPVKDSLMYFQTVPTRRSLGQDDRDGISYLYPASIGSSACGTISVDAAAGGQQGPLIFIFLLTLALSLPYALKLVPRR